MNLKRAALMALSLAGLVGSSWMARPEELASVDGWLFAVGWTSLAWCILFWGSMRWRSHARVAAGLIAVTALDVALFAFSNDPLMLAAKPLWQLPALGLAIGIDYMLRTTEGSDV